MLFGRERIAALGAKAMMLDVVAWFFPVGHVVERQIRYLRKRIVERFRSHLLRRLQRGDGLFERSDLRHELGGLFLILGFLGLADFLRGGVAACLGGLQLKDFLAPRLVQGDQPLRFRREPAPRQRSVEDVRMFANEADVVHEPYPVSWPDLFRPSTSLGPDT